MVKKIVNAGQKIANERAVELAAPILPWFTKGNLLDYGCGIGHLGYHISQSANLELFSLDIRKYPVVSHPAIKPVLFDGITIPYPENHFETVFVGYTLHHTISAKEALQEIIRVAKNRIIVSEDFLKTRKHIPIEVVKDILANYFFAHITMQYRTVNEWEDMFKDLGMNIRDRIFHTSGKLLHFEHVSWLLDKQSVSYENHQRE